MTRFSSSELFQKLLKIRDSPAGAGLHGSLRCACRACDPSGTLICRMAEQHRFDAFPETSGDCYHRISGIKNTPKSAAV